MKGVYQLKSSEQKTGLSAEESKQLVLVNEFIFFFEEHKESYIHQHFSIADRDRFSHEDLYKITRSEARELVKTALIRYTDSSADERVIRKYLDFLIIRGYLEPCDLRVKKSDKTLYLIVISQLREKSEQLTRKGNDFVRKRINEIEAEKKRLEKNACASLLSFISTSYGLTESKSDGDRLNGDGQNCVLKQTNNPFASRLNQNKEV
jgi:hypothetical protein